MLERAWCSLDGLVSETIIVVGVGQASPRIPNASLVCDIFPEKGPLGGIYTGLSVSSTRYNVVTACDLPFLQRDLLRYMVSKAPGFDAVVPRMRSFIEPLCAIYSKRCMNIIAGLISENRLRIQCLLERVEVRYIDEDEIDSFDPAHLSFLNINTAADLDRARALVDLQPSLPCLEALHQGVISDI